MIFVMKQRKCKEEKGMETLPNSVPHPDKESTYAEEEVTKEISP